MKRIFFLATIIFFSLPFWIPAQEPAADTVHLDEVVITASRMPEVMATHSGAVSLVTSRALAAMPRSVGAEEALRLVPGIRIDNQHNGERVHISIRGQGILTERGLRGIGVVLDGIPLNDPSGFAPDLYDVDWNMVERIEVLRGPAAGLYGSSGAGGILQITTRSGGQKPLEGWAGISAGSYGFYKTYASLNGTLDHTDYRLSYTRDGGNGYRIHQAFWSNKLYEKVSFHPGERLHITQILSHTDYFHQNPEGLNLSQLDDPRQANPDAIPYNEYQKTNRTTLGMTGEYRLTPSQKIRGYAFLRTWRYKETSNKYAEYRDYTDPGAGLQYELDLATGKVSHHLSAGTDLNFQGILMHKLKSAPDPGRKDGLDETNIETDTLLANQTIDQSSLGLYAIYRLERGRFSLTGNIRYDNIRNSLTDKMVGKDSATTRMDFSHTTFRVGMNFALTPSVYLYANYSQGFLPPSTEELAANPLGYSGFNTHLVPATAGCYEVGTRGRWGERFYFDVTLFTMKTENDFFRFKQKERGNQEVFYGNAGNSRRYGVETYLSYRIAEPLTLQAAYTFSDFRYTSATIDPIYLDTNYVLTTPPAPGQYLPNSPKHQLYAEMNYTLQKKVTFTLGVASQSRWAIYTDAKAYHGELDPSVFRNWQKGFTLFNARISYRWRYRSTHGTFSVSARNFTGTHYMAFTEPDPDGNSYQPGPTQEFFASFNLHF